MEGWASKPSDKANYQFSRDFMKQITNQFLCLLICCFLCSVVVMFVLLVLFLSLMSSIAERATSERRMVQKPSIMQFFLQPTMDSATFGRSNDNTFRPKNYSLGMVYHVRNKCHNIKHVTYEGRSQKNYSMRSVNHT